MASFRFAYPQDVRWVTPRRLLAEHMQSMLQASNSYVRGQVVGKADKERIEWLREQLLVGTQAKQPVVSVGLNKALIANRRDTHSRVCVDRATADVPNNAEASDSNPKRVRGVRHAPT